MQSCTFKNCVKSRSNFFSLAWKVQEPSFTAFEYNGAHRHLRKIDSAAPRHEHNDIRAS